MGNHIGSVMLSVFTLSVVDHGVEPHGRVKPKTLVFAVSLLSTQH